MKTNIRKHHKGFTLIEMVGVLAVIAILAALLVPKIFAAIDESRYNNTVSSINGVKAATMSYFGKVGSFTNVTDFAQVLITAGYLENPFTPKIGVSPAVTVASSTTPSFTKLDGVSATVSGSIVYINLGAIPAEDARELSRRIDGTDMSANDLTSADDEGRVIYAAPSGGNATTLVYLAHK